MVLASRHIDIEAESDFSEVVSEVVASHLPVIVRMAGEDVALISPIAKWQPGEPREYTEEELAEFMATGGGWKGIVDTDALRDALAESRSIPTKPRVRV
jgi:hypothetical protein